jgi:penicillin amidase
LVYADVDGNLGYQTMVWVPKMRRTHRIALEGWTGEDELGERITLEELPHLLNPASHVVSHANNLPVGSWYPHDLGIGTGGIGHTSRSLRLVELLYGARRFSVDDFERAVHRDDVNPSVANLFPVARRLVEESRSLDTSTTELLRQLKDWDLRYRADQATYPAANALANSLLTLFRRSPLAAKLGGGEGGIAHLARRMNEQYGTGGVPSDPDVRSYLLSWLQTAGQAWQQNPRQKAPVNGKSTEVAVLTYESCGPLRFPSANPLLDKTSPPLSCGQGGTIWSQLGNSYSQIVDLANPDNSRSLLPPGNSEDPDSPFHTDQMALWVEGGTHPAPLSRQQVENMMASRTVLEVSFSAKAAIRRK